MEEKGDTAHPRGVKNVVGEDQLDCGRSTKQDLRTPGTGLDD